MAGPIPPAATGAEMRLDAVLDELRALRAEVKSLRPQPPASPPEVVGLREPARPKGKR